MLKNILLAVVSGFAFLFLVPIWRGMWPDAGKYSYANDIIFILISISMLGFLSVCLIFFMRLFQQ